MVKAKKQEGDDFDMNDDGVVSEEELNVVTTKSQIIKTRAQEKMAWASIGAICAFTAVLLCLPPERVNALAEVSNLFYISMAGIVGAFMGMTAYMCSVGGKK